MRQPARWCENHPTTFAFVVLAVLVSTQIFLVCDTVGDFWFEDDAPHRVFVRDHNNPLAYFGPELVARLSQGHSVTPWFPFTFWLDQQVSAVNPLPAYLHTGLSLWLTACAGFVLLCRLMPRRYALVTSCLWLYLPSTVVITEFLSTRHYLEGLLFSCLSLLSCLRSLESVGRQRFYFTALAAVLFLLATTTKEVYVSATWFALITLYLFARRWGATALMVACALAYSVYRFGSLGLVGKNLSTSFADRYYLFLVRWPYMFTGNEGGYALLLVGVMLLLWLVWRRRIGWKAAVLIAGLISVMLLTIFPVSAHVTDQYRELGTWYRVVFLLNGFMLGLAGWLVARLEMSRPAVVIAFLAGLLILPGAWETSRRWDEIKGRYTADAGFYLDHPDRLLYSSLPAPWFIYGIHHLYQPEREPHYLTWRVDKATDASFVQEAAEKYEEIWVAVGGEFRADRSLLLLIEKNCSEGVIPLHEGWLPENNAD